MDPVLLVGIISGSSAIVASVGAQIAGTLITRSAANKRLDLEERRFKLEVNAAAKIRFESEKREAFVDYLSQVDELTDFLMLLSAHPFRAIARAKKYESLHKNLVRSYYKIKLISPTLEPQMDSLMALFENQTAGVLGWNEQWEKQVIPQGKALRREMSSLLGIEQIAPETHNQPQLNEAPVSGDNNKPQPTT